jgi:hypothetical protein
MKSKPRVYFVLFAVLAFVSVFAMGCKGATEEPVETTVAVSPLPQQSIGPGVADSPLVAPPSDPIDFEVKPAPGKAVFKGTIQLTTSTVVLGELFLATAEPTSDPGIDVLGLDQESAPKASIDRSTGQFIYVDVEPGKYGLIVWEPLNSYPVADPETGKTLFVELLPDQVIDVGELSIP